MLLGTTTIPRGTMRQATSLVAATLLVAGSLGCSGGDGEESIDAEAATMIGEALPG
jgi:hypothetical protein